MTILNAEESSPEVSLEGKLQQEPPTPPITKLKTSDSDDPTTFYKDSDYENVNPSNTEDGTYSYNSFLIELLIKMKEHVLII